MPPSSLPSPAPKALPHFRPPNTIDAGNNHLAMLSCYFQSLNAPYELDDILEFNRIYQRIYGQLNATERRRAEQIVDLLIEGVADPNHIPKIFGVV